MALWETRGIFHELRNDWAGKTNAEEWLYVMEIADVPTPHAMTTTTDTMGRDSTNEQIIGESHDMGKMTYSSRPPPVQQYANYAEHTSTKPT